MRSVYKNDYGKLTLANTGIIQLAIHQKKYPKSSGVKDTTTAYNYSQYVSLLEFKQGIIFFFQSQDKSLHSCPSVLHNLVMNDSPRFYVSTVSSYGFK